MGAVVMGSAMNYDKKPYYERYWYIPWVISLLALSVSIIKLYITMH